VSAIAVGASDTSRLFAGVSVVHDAITGELIDAPGGPSFAPTTAAHSGAT
jgi:hypothetical protein